MKKRKILASLMATGFAFCVGITTASVVMRSFSFAISMNNLYVM